MTRFSEKAIEEMNKEKELQFSIDYECVQFGIWLHELANPIYMGLWEIIIKGTVRNYTTEELYQLYKNEQANNISKDNSNNNVTFNPADDITY